MKQFIAFIKKEFYHILRDKRTMLILIGMPVVQIILFGFAISTEVRNVQTAVLINSANTDIQRIVDQLDASEYFNVKYVVHSPTEIEDLFAKNKIETCSCLCRRFKQTAFGLRTDTDYSRCNRSQSRSHTWSVCKWSTFEGTGSNRAKPFCRKNYCIKQTAV